MSKLKVFKQSADRHKRLLMEILRELYKSCDNIKHDSLFGYVSNDELLDHILEQIARYYNMIGESKYE